MYADAVEADPDRHVVALTAVPCQTKRRDEKPGRGVVRSLVQEFIFRVSDIDAAGLDLPPEIGHSVYWDGKRWDCTKPDGDRSVWQFHDDAHSQIRVRCQLVSDAFDDVASPDWFDDFVRTHFEGSSP